MVSRRFIFLASILATAISFFTLGVMHARRTETLAANAYDAKIDAIRTEGRTALGRVPPANPAGSAGTSGHAKDDATPSAAARARMVAEIKQELQNEMGLLPLHLLRDRRASFVELYSYDNLGKTNYGTAGYLG